VDRFIAKENIKHFVDRLETKGEGLTRAMLWQPLIAEIDNSRTSLDSLNVLEENIFRLGVNRPAQVAGLNDVLCQPVRWRQISVRTWASRP
jgi:hypothetical protein